MLHYQRNEDKQLTLITREITLVVAITLSLQVINQTHYDSANRSLAVHADDSRRRDELCGSFAEVEVTRGPLRCDLYHRIQSIVKLCLIELIRA